MHFITKHSMPEFLKYLVAETLKKSAELPENPNGTLAAAPEAIPKGTGLKLSKYLAKQWHNMTSYSYNLMVHRQRFQSKPMTSIC